MPPLFSPEFRSSARAQRIGKYVVFTCLALILLAIALFFGTRIWLRHAMRASLPQLDGTITLSGPTAPITVRRDAQGLPHIAAQNLDDLVFAQAFVTAQDRLWQMDILRRHAAGDLAQILGGNLIQHDQRQRYLQLRNAADATFAAMPADETRWLLDYARGVNAFIALNSDHLPAEFRLLHYKPAPWQPRDSILIGLVMMQDLTTEFPIKLSRELVESKLPPELAADLYPTGSWRDHPPGQPPADLTQPQENVPDIPLDESQTKLVPPSSPVNNWSHPERSEGPACASASCIGTTTAPGGPSFAASSRRVGSASDITRQSLAALQQSLTNSLCEECKAGSNNWAVSGSRTASGKPLLANDMHLGHTIPSIWYQADLEIVPPPNSNSQLSPGAQPFHVAGVSLPGLPFIVVGHNQHIAWGFTNSGADVQDLYVEKIENDKYQTADNQWHPLSHVEEKIEVRGGKSITLDVTFTQHGEISTPIITPIIGREKRAVALNWVIYDPHFLRFPMLAINSATDWASFNAAFAVWGGPSQNAVYADDQGHIGFHLTGKIPIRASSQPAAITPAPIDASLAGGPVLPSALTPSPQSTIATHSSTLSPRPVTDFSHGWQGYIPYDQLPQVLDPIDGIVASANARTTPDAYPLDITLDWAAPYRNERIYKVLGAAKSLTPQDMLKLQTDIHSELELQIAQRLAYAIDHSTNPNARLKKAADILRTWNGEVTADAPAPSIVRAARPALWRLLLQPYLGNDWPLYSWENKAFAQEELIVHQPARWLPKGFTNWNDLLTRAVEQGLLDAHSPYDLSTWSSGRTNPVAIQHPVYPLIPMIQKAIGLPTGTGKQPQSGDTTTVKQVAATFGPSERLTVDLSNLDNSTLNLVIGQSGNPLSPNYLDQFHSWLTGQTYPLPFSDSAVQASTTHTLTLQPQ